MSNDGAYATNGRIGVRWDVEGIPYDVPEGFPIEPLRKMLAEAEKATWHTIDETDLHVWYGDIQRKLKEVKSDRMRAYEDRYRARTCPCCGEMVWEDNLAEELLETRPDPEDVCLEADIDFPVCLDFGQGARIMQLPYVKMVLDDFYDVHFGIREDTNLIYFKANAGGVTGVIVGMKPYGLDCDRKIRMTKCEDASKAREGGGDV